MPRVCQVCAHEQRPVIDRALVRGTAHRDVAKAHGLSEDAVTRHRKAHVPAKLAKAEDAREVAQADSLLTELRALRSKAVRILLNAEAAGNYYAALGAIREARQCIELLAEMEGELDRRPQINLLVAPQWIQIRGVLLEALQPYPEAKLAVVGSLQALDAA